MGTNKKITEDEFEIKLADMIIKYLAENSSATTHQLAMSWNFDNPNTVIDWIVDNPKTDKATASMLYWLMTPSYSKGYTNRDEVSRRNSWYLEQFDTIEKLEARYLAGFYINQEFAFNPNCDEWEINRVKENSDKGKREIPQAMMGILKGKEIAIPENWNDGIPSDLLEEYDYLVGLLDEIDEVILMTTEAKRELYDMDSEECIAILEALSAEEMGYDLVGILARAYNNNDQAQKAKDLMLTVKAKGEKDGVWNYRMGYSCFCLKEYKEALDFLEDAKELGCADWADELLPQCKALLSPPEPSDVAAIGGDEYVATIKHEDSISVCFYIEHDKPIAIGEKMEEIHEEAYMNGYNWEAFFNFYLPKHAPDIYSLNTG